MDRRTFLRTAGLVGIAGASGCSLPFDSSPLPNGSDGNGSGETPELTPTPEPPDTRSGAALTGVYAGGDGLVANLDSYSSWLGQKPAVALVFVDAFGPTSAKRGFVEGALTNVWKAGHVPLISWQPFEPQKNQTSETIEREIANGEYDDQIDEWASLLDSWAHPRGDNTRGRRFYFRPAHEMNGNWFPWSALDATRVEATAAPETDDGDGEDPTAGIPEDYVGMWRQLYKRFSETKLDESNIQWIWSPNADEIGGIRAERYYPGDDYVDWVGLDGFNFGGSQQYSTGQSNWRSPAELFDPMLNRMRELTDKPVALTEFASSSIPSSGNGHDPQQKAQWIDDAFSYVSENDIKMTCWFNVDKTGQDETDWAVFGGSRGTDQASVGGEQYSSYQNYKQALSADKYLAALPDYPPLLTDDEFAGKF
ncbi:glycoside hydrolase family 26 protein [Halococcus qingdaonensis]|uniref:glycoside hydrolase family 26 protein n=1 Tax=Halococcus qingdaonensis TaxID=224402 RepID=UPI0021167BE2|nr:glycosyl hydrolase [Halococcus qingdaonensis]